MPFQARERGTKAFCCDISADALRFLFGHSIIARKTLNSHRERSFTAKPRKSRQLPRQSRCHRVEHPQAVVSTTVH